MRSIVVETWGKSPELRVRFPRLDNLLDHVVPRLASGSFRGKHTKAPADFRFLQRVVDRAFKLKPAAPAPDAPEAAVKPASKPAERTEARQAAAEFRPFFTRELPQRLEDLYTMARDFYAEQNPAADAPGLFALVSFVRHQFLNYRESARAFEKLPSMPPPGYPIMWEEVRARWTREAINTLRLVYGCRYLARRVKELQRQIGRASCRERV